MTPDQLREFLAEERWTREQGARFFGVTRDMVQRWLSGRAPIRPYVPIMVSMWRALTMRKRSAILRRLWARD